MVSLDFLALSLQPSDEPHFQMTRRLPLARSLETAEQKGLSLAEQASVAGRRHGRQSRG